MPTMNVSLPAEMAAFVEAELASGDYASASEVVRDALRLLRRERAAEQERLAILRREIQRGVDDADAGRFSSESIKDIAARVIADRSGR
ncbi:type II toxin-antitoxin system ParD family antitoxin [Magnetospirillum sp. 64-120]|uniref:type II toxin-antitoxin system ParD family antitoxin n=1 Tax=Magnetospirillum sp. 64-120 TaxID=1895778 RepID=UPI0025C01652|nr:type II toxin-antitoxin system ParD family antitoxin [Magnetospirillum sp. 64-120]